jgi:hypothetical protein
VIAARPFDQGKGGNGKDQEVISVLTLQVSSKQTSDKLSALRLRFLFWRLAVVVGDSDCRARTVGRVFLVGRCIRDRQLSKGPRSTWARSFSIAFALWVTNGDQPPYKAWTFPNYPACIVAGHSRIDSMKDFAPNIQWQCVEDDEMESS